MALRDHITTRGPKGDAPLPLWTPPRRGTAAPNTSPSLPETAACHAAVSVSKEKCQCRLIGTAYHYVGTFSFCGQAAACGGGAEGFHGSQGGRYYSSWTTARNHAMLKDFPLWRAGVARPFQSRRRRRRLPSPPLPAYSSLPPAPPGIQEEKSDYQGKLSKTRSGLDFWAICQTNVSNCLD